MASTKKFLLVVLSSVLVKTVASSKAENANSKSSSYSTDDQSENNIAFDLPDLTATITLTKGREFHIEAFKSINNDGILSRADQMTAHSSQLLWVSAGQPTFIKTEDPMISDEAKESNSTSSMKIFHSVPNGYYAYIQMLTSSHRRLLAARATAQYRTEISENQIVNLILSRFECFIQLMDETGNKQLIKGQVSDFRTFPLRMDFKAPQNSIERQVFDKMLKTSGGEDQNDLHFTCQMSSRGKIVKINTLIIELQQLERLGLQDKLFGPSSSSSSGLKGQHRDTVYVTRDQLLYLAAEMYSTLNVIEDYQIPELQFSEDFVRDLLQQVSATHFIPVPIDAALESLSKYGLNFADDLQPDRIKHELSHLFYLQNNSGRESIVLNNTMYNKLLMTIEGSRHGSTKDRCLGIAKSAEWAEKNAEMSSTSVIHTVAEQLKDLNSASKNDIGWAREGEMIVPKSLVVAKLSHSQFNRELTFSRIKLLKYAAPFDREFGMYTRTAAKSNPTSTSSEDSCQRESEVSASGKGILSPNINTQTVTDLVGRLISNVSYDLKLAIAGLSEHLQQLKSSIEFKISSMSTLTCQSSSSRITQSSVPTAINSPAALNNRQLLSATYSEALSDGRCVTGIASLNGLLYIGRSMSSALEIHNASTLRFIRRSLISGLVCIEDMATRHELPVIYVMDRCINKILVVNENAVVQSQWFCDRTPTSLSIAVSSSNVLVTFEDSNIIKEYTMEGRLVNEITLQSDLGVPVHVIQSSVNRFIVAQASLNNGGLNRVSIIDEQGRQQRSFGDIAGSGNTRVRMPIRLAQLYNSLFVVDSYNDRIIELNSTTLAYIRDAVDFPTNSEFFHRITFSHDNERMFLAHNDYRLRMCTAGKVRAYNLRWTT